MRSMRGVLASLLAGLALVAAGCGGSATSAPAARAVEAAKVVPGDAIAFVSLDTDLDSLQWTKVKALADRFPGKDELVAMVLKELGEENVDFQRDVEPALGSQVAVVVLASSDPVALTQPEDRGKLDALLAKDDEPSVTAELDDGWIAIAESQTVLDAFRSAAGRGTLADDAFFTEALEGLPEDTIATAFVRGEGLLDAIRKSSGGELPSLPGLSAFRSLGAAVEATDDGLHLAGSIRSDQALGESYDPTLFERVPDRVIAALSFHGSKDLLSQVRSNQQLRSYLPIIESTLGISIDDVASLLEGQGAFYVRPGLPIPELTVALETDDEAAAMEKVDRLMRALGRLANGTVATTGETHSLTIQGFRISWAADAGVLVVSSGATGIADFRSDGDKLEDDDAFRRASEHAGLGDQTSGFVYFDLQQLVPLLESLASFAGAHLPAEARDNLAPLDGLMIQASAGDDGVTRFEGFLGVRDR